MPLVTAFLQAMVCELSMFRYLVLEPGFVWKSNLSFFIFIIAHFHVQVQEFGSSYQHDLLGFNRTRGFTRLLDICSEMDVAVGDLVDAGLKVMQPVLKLVASSVSFEDHISVVTIYVKECSHAEVVFG